MPRRIVLVTTLLLFMVDAYADSSVVRLELKGISLQVPTSWKQSDENGSLKLVAPDGDAYVTIDVGAVEGRMTSKVCLDKILEAMGGPKGWSKLTLGKQPAARRIDVDAVPETGDAVESHTFVGCNGKTTWAEIFVMNKKHQKRFAPIAQTIAKSVIYSAR